ncbi:hypothetical protein B5F76_07160 [Desulfovibrio sp. An276]|nr:hypothetical protein B5F76_07160 [Desulfovibrio sp. An276]
MPGLRHIATDLQKDPAPCQGSSRSFTLYLACTLHVQRLYFGGIFPQQKRQKKKFCRKGSRQERQDTVLLRPVLLGNRKKQAFSQGLKEEIPCPFGVAGGHKKKGPANVRPFFMLSCGMRD